MTISGAASLDLGTLLPFAAAVLLVLIVLNTVLKKSKEKKVKKAYEGLSQGDDVVLINGMLGKVTSRANGTVEVELSGHGRARFMEYAVAEINGKKIKNTSVIFI